MKNSKSIFLIEDDKDDQLFFIEALSGIENASLSHIAGNGKEALTALLKSDSLPDIIFTDINMPVMDGIECLSAISKDPRTRHIPVIVLSSDISKVEAAERTGATAFIEKPSEYGMLRKQLERVINTGRMAGKETSPYFRNFISAS